MARKMKDSGIEWIGEIPEDWKLSKLKWFVKIKSGEYLNKNKFIDDGNVDVFGANAKLGNYDKSNIKKKTIVTGRVGTLGTFDIKDNVWITDNVLAIDVLNANLNFVYYFFHIINFEELASSTAQPLITATKLYNINFSFPTNLEQNKISDFLDIKTKEIYRVKSIITKEIQTLEDYKKSVITEAVTKGLDKNIEMKDSGIEWIGEIPKHWELNKGKYILKLLKKPVKDSDEVITCFRDGEVTLRSKRREEGFTFADKEIGYQGIDVGDLVVHGMDGFAGAIGISDSRGKGSPVLNVLDSICEKRYLMFYLRAMSYSDIFSALATGIRVRSVDLRWNKLANLPYPLPSKDEQNKIANFIENELYKTDSLISTKQKQLQILEEYKKSLIYEYVTGKKEVEDVGTI